MVVRKKGTWGINSNPMIRSSDFEDICDVMWWCALVIWCDGDDDGDDNKRLYHVGWMVVTFPSVFVIDLFLPYRIVSYNYKFFLKFIYVWKCETEAYITIVRFEVQWSGAAIHNIFPLFLSFSFIRSRRRKQNILDWSNGETAMANLFLVFRSILCSMFMHLVFLFHFGVWE